MTMKSLASWLVFGMVVTGAPAAQAFGPRDAGGGRVVHGVCGNHFEPASAESLKKCPRRASGQGPQPKRIIFLNRNGGSYTAGPSTDSATNKINLRNTGGTQAPGGTMPPVNVDDAGWAEIVACVNNAFAPFNVTVVESEPASGNYIEAVVGGGTEEDIGYDPGLPMNFNLLGVASADGLGPGGGCALTEKGIAFTMAGGHPSPLSGAGPGPANNRKYLCTTIAHEVGHVMGLEHAVDRDDYMTYETQPLDKSFIDEASLCGTEEAQPMACSCPDVSSQNSFQVLTEYLGPKDDELPTVTVTSPAAGAAVGPGFEVTVEASDNYRVEQVQMLIGGMVVASDVAPPFKVNAPNNVAIGPLDFEIHAIDKSSNRGVQMLAVTVEPGCSGDGDCEDDEVCVNQVCLGDLGATCSSGDDCASDLCAAPLGGAMTSKFCTKTCNGSDECPSGFTCSDELGGAEKCVPGGGGGGCGVAGDPRAAGVTGLLAALAILVARRRRRS